MARCEGEVSFSAEATIPEIKEVFPDAITLPILNPTEETPGVYVVDDQDIRIVKIVGPCPNLVSGECVFGVPCPINALINKEQ